MMEWAQAFEVLSGFAQGDVAADNVGDLNPIFDLVDQFVSNQASPHESRSSCPLAEHDRTSRLLSDGKIDRSG